MALQIKEKIGETNNERWTFKQVATENSIAEDSNDSSVTVELFLGRADSQSYVGGSYSCYVTVGDKTKSFSGTIPYPTYINGSAWYSLGSITFDWVEHNDDGTKTVTIKSSLSSTAFTPSSASAEDEMTLTPIDIGTIRIVVNNEIKRATPYYGVNYEWKKCKAYVGDNYEWKKGK